MDELQIYIYLALALIYFLSQAFRKKKPKQPRGYGESDTAEEETSRIPERDRSMTFEELLEEFTGQRSEEKAKEEARKKAREAYELEEEPEEPEIMKDDEYKVYDEYDDYKASAYREYTDYSAQSSKLKTLDEQVDIEEPIEKLFDGYQDKYKQTRADKYRKILSNPETIKDAIILKEILDPKYF